MSTATAPVARRQAAFAAGVSNGASAAAIASVTNGILPLRRAHNR
jgi:hypothetical protein